jgi:hypothetical protein
MRALNNPKDQYVCKEKTICRLVVRFAPDPVPIELIIAAINKVV